MEVRRSKSNDRFEWSEDEREGGREGERERDGGREGGREGVGVQKREEGRRGMGYTCVHK